MCGIFGAIFSPSTSCDTKSIKNTLMTLGHQAQSRGKDSSGLVLLDSYSKIYSVFKGASPIKSLLRNRDVLNSLDRQLKAMTGEKQGLFLAIGHSRLVTNGSQFQDENNQPVVKDGIIGVHNGIIVNNDKLWDSVQDSTRLYDIDTEVLLSLVRQYLNKGLSVPSAMAHTDRLIEGTYSIALLFEDRDVMILGTNNGSLYSLHSPGNYFLFASESYPLRLIQESGLLDSSQCQIHQIESGTGMILNFRDLSAESFSIKDDFSSAQLSSSADTAPYQINILPVSNKQPQPELVREVAVIARMPEAKREEALLEYNLQKIALLQRCTKCLLPETFPFIHFDAHGVCNYCNNYRIKNHPKPLSELLDLVEPYRNRNGKADCIVPFSGGRDSTHALHLIKNELGLNPIAFTYDWGMVTDLGRRNIARVCGKLGVENIIVAADIHWKRKNIRKNIQAWLKRPHLGMIPLFMAGDKYFYHYVDQVKKQTGISLNIWGINPLENTDFKVGFIGVGPDHDKERIYSLSLQRQFKLFSGVAKAIVANPRYLNGSIIDTLGSFCSRSIKKHTDYFHLYDYYRWDETEIDKILFELYDWEKATDTNTTWRIGDGTAAFYNYIYFTVAGFSEHDTFRSNQIREGMISREEAMALVLEENKPRYATIKWYTEMVGVDYDSTIRIINSIPKLYE